MYITIELVIFGLISLLLMWCLICNNRTRNQQFRIIDIIYEHNSNYIKESFNKLRLLKTDEEIKSFWIEYTLGLSKYRDDFHEISYNRYLWELIILHDPNKLYSQEIQDIIAKGG